MVSFLTTINMLRRHLVTFFDKQHKQTMNQMGALKAFIAKTKQL